MATPIKTTPLLKGKDAVFFYKQLAKSSKKVSVNRTVVSANDRRRIANAVSNFLKSKAA
jgi:hypothetical protein